MEGYGAPHGGSSPGRQNSGGTEPHRARATAFTPPVLPQRRTTMPQWRKCFDVRVAAMDEAGGKVVVERGGGTERHEEAAQARRRDVVQALQRVHVQPLAVDQDLYQGQPRRLRTAMAPAIPSIINNS